MLIPFSRLYLSDANVRKTRSEEDDIQLSADIEARGLLQNLLVTKSKKRGKFAVIAGGRRLRAIEMIVTRGAWAPDTEIECKLLEGSEEEAGEASLAENFQRVGMSPAEECRAFQHFIKEGSDVAAVAKRFGLTQRFVEGRLRLANLAEPIFEALAKGDVTLEIAKAYAATDQHEVQLRVFEQMRYAYNPSADAIRRMVASGSMRGNDPIALLIGEDAYVAAGGKIERDLFSEAADDRWIDIEIAHRLAAEKMEAEAQRIAAETGLAWISPVASTNSWQARSEMGVNAVRLPPAPLSEEARARIDAIDARMEEISEIIDEGHEGGEADFGQLEAEYEDLDAERSELNNPVRELPEEWRSATVLDGSGLAGGRLLAICGVTGHRGVWLAAAVPGLDRQPGVAGGRLRPAGLPLCGQVAHRRAGQSARQLCPGRCHAGREPLAGVLASHPATGVGRAAPRHGVCRGHRAGRVCGVAVSLAARMDHPHHADLPTPGPSRRGQPRRCAGAGLRAHGAGTARFCGH